MMTNKAWLILWLFVVELNWATGGTPSKDGVVSARVMEKGRSVMRDNNSSRLEKKTECHSLVVIENTNSICRPEIVGRVRFKAEQRLLEICDGSLWLSTSLQNGPIENPRYGSIKMSGESCRDIMGHYKAVLENGIYWIRLQGERSSFPVYCDMKNRGWTMVFKTVSGASSNPADLWFAPIAVNENDLSALDLSDDFKKSYKNRIINKWRDFSPSEARVVLFRRGEPVLQITFNAAYRDNANWFSMSQVIDSPWTDLTKEPKNFFSIAGWQVSNQNARSFYINRHHGGCEKDAGWLVTTYSACQWENRFPMNSILYSKTGRYTNWNIHENVGFADVLAVFVN